MIKKILSRLETQLESCFNTKIEWFFQDKVISKFNDKHKKKYEIVNDLTSNTTKLLIKSPEPSDSGNYFMKATNAAGSSISKCNVIIEGKLIKKFYFKLF